MRNRRGNYASLSALSMVVLLGFAALSVDFARLYTAKSQIQSNTDAAVMSALIVYRNEVGNVANPEVAAQTAAQYIYDSNVVAEDYGKVKMEFSMGVYDWEQATANPLNRMAAFSPGAGAAGERNAVHIRGIRTNGGGTNSVDTLLAPIFGGPDEVDVDAEALSAFRFRDIMMITDTTRSLNTSEITNVRLANQIFLQTMEDIQVPGDQVGLTVFTGEAETVSELQKVKDANDFRVWFESIQNCSFSNDAYYYYWFGWSDVFPYAYGRRTQRDHDFSYSRMIDGLDDMLGGDMDGVSEREWYDRMDGGSGSRNWTIGSIYPGCNNGRDPGQFWGENGYGINNYAGATVRYWYGPGDPRNTTSTRSGWRWLDNDNRVWTTLERAKYFGDTGTNQFAALLSAKAELDSPRARQGSLRVAILFTDGEPNLGTDGPGSTTQKRDFLYDLARQAGQQMCSEGISIFTVSYNNNDDPTEYARQSGFLSDLAEDPYGNGEPCNYGKFYETPDSADLPGIMEEIARELPIMLVQ